MPIKLYSKVIYVINLTICDYNPVISDMKVQNLNLPREGHNFQYIVDYIQFFSKSQHALYFLLPYSYFPILFLLQLVQKLGLSISSTSRWEWHTKLLLSLRTVSTQTPQICYRKDCTDLTFFFFFNTSSKGSNDDNIPVASKSTALWLPSSTSETSENRIYNQQTFSCYINVLYGLGDRSEPDIHITLKVS